VNRFLVAVSLLMVLICHVTEASEGGKAAQTKTPVKAIRFDALEKLIKSQENKIVVVYFWAVYNPPSMAMYPGFMKLDQRYRQDVATITVSLDPADDQERDERQARVEKFVDRMGSQLPIYILDENDGAQKLNVVTVPSVVVFDRKGRQIAVFDLRAKNPDSLLTRIEKTLAKLIAAKNP
jgi:thiol-disulfide isomerase/thioredoxin